MVNFILFKSLFLEGENMKILFAITALATAVFCTPALAQNTSKGFYLGAALNAGDSNLSTGGFNTAGAFFNSDCDPKVSFLLS